MRNKLINFSFVSTFLTGNRTFITRNYNQDKYANESQFLIDFEKRWQEGIRDLHFQGTVYPEVGELEIFIGLDLKSKKIKYFYVHILKTGQTLGQDYWTKIEWHGNMIKSIDFNFSNKTIKLL